MKKLNRDVESGLAHMVMALILVDKENNKVSLDNFMIELTKQITKITQLPLAPINYFEYAIDQSRATNYLETLIPSLMHYGGFLFKKESQNNNLGLKLLSEANKLANLHEMGWSQKDIIKYCESLNITMNDLE